MQRRIKSKNTIISTKEGENYRIISVLGQGGSSVVYKAEHLIENTEQPVLIKAFVMPDNFSCSEDFNKYVENELNINKDIEKINFAGAMPIAYPVHDCNDGTIYGITSKVYSGTTLRDYVSSEEYQFMSLKDKIILIKHLSQLVRNFHNECKMIHGDITPDNIYVLDTANEETNECRTNVLLYDFGSSQYIDDEKNMEFPFVFATDGYSASDIQSGMRKRLEENDDWYAVLSCSWFCLSGKDTTDFKITPENIDKVCQSYAVSYEKNGFFEEAELSLTEWIQFPLELDDIAAKIKNFFLDFDGNQESFSSNIKNIIELLEKSGINRNNLRAELKREYKNLHKNRFSNLNIIHKILPEVDLKLQQNQPHLYKLRDGGQRTLREIMEDCNNSFLLIGDGGMGKTTSLINIMNETYLSGKMDDEILVVFIELCTISQNSKDWYTEGVGATFLEQFLASYFTDQPRGFVKKNHPCISVLRNELFRNPPNGTPQYDILLDGMNEIGFLNEESKFLFFEGINHYLKYAQNVRLVITSRSDVCELTTDNLSRSKAIGLSEKSITDILEAAVMQEKLSQQKYDTIIHKKTILYTSESRLWQCLKIPFFLIMYCVVSEKETVSSQGEILRNFFQDKRGTLDLAMNRPIMVALDFIIPEIALDMAEDNQFFISSQDMIALSDQYVQQIAQEEESFQWMKSYYSYPTDIKDILREMPDSTFGERILEIACEMLGVMRCTADNMLFFTHQYFRDYFAASAITHRIRDALEISVYRDQKLNASTDSFSKIVNPLHQHEFPFSINALVGEILGERKNLPVYDEKNKTWHHIDFQSQMRPVITDFLDFYRNLDAEKGSQVYLGLRNVISILKSSRINSYGKADLSGMNLKNLDLQGISLSGIILSHFGENSKNVYCADLSGSKSVLKAIMHDDIKEDVKCCGMHSGQKLLALWNKTTGQISEFDIDEMAIKNLFWADTYVKGIFYTPDSNNIWLVEATKRSKKKSTGKNGLGNRILEKLQIKEMNPASDKKDIPRIKVSYYDRYSQKSISKKFDNYEFLDVSYSQEFLQLSLFVKNPNKVILIILDISPKEEMLPTELIRVSESELPLKESFCQKISPNTFMHCRIDRNYYLISDSTLQNGSIGKYNIQDGKCETICYIDSLDSEESITSFCKNSTDSKIYYLKSSTNHFESVNSRVSNSELGFIKGMHVHPCEKIEFLENRNELLILSKKQLKLVDTNSRKTIWICSLVVEDFYLEHNTLIVNTCNGIYDVDLLYGSYTCLYQFQEQEVQFILGQTSLPTTVVLYESTGNVKWICVENGCCERQAVLQVPEEKIEQIYCDCSDWIIYGISGQHIYCWNAISGAMLQNYAILCDAEEESFQFCTFGSVQIVQVYFEMQDYNVFPMTKKYFVKDWDLKKQEWVHGKAEKNIHEERFREVLSFHDYQPYTRQDAKKDMDGFIHGKGLYALETELKEDNPPDVRWQNTENSIGKKFIRKIFNMACAEDNLDIFDEEIPKEDMVLWQLPSKKLKIGNKNISHRRGVIDLSRLRTIDEADYIIGVSAKKGMLYSTNNYSEYIDLHIAALKTEEDIEMPALHGTEVENAFVTGDTFVALAKSVVNGSRKLIFWNMEENPNKAYIYQIRKNIIATGCKIDCSADSKEEKEMLSMEGILDAERFYFID